MSQIFDALHQSATVLTGGSLGEFAAAKDLLQVVERKVPAPVPAEEEPAFVPKLTRQWPSVQPILPIQSKLVCFTQSESLASEKFRFLATRLRHMQQKRTLKRLVITSSVTGEGKSMVAGNLACALAGGRQRVLLIEGDLRRPSLGQQLGLRELPGLSQLLQNAGGEHGNIAALENFGLCVLLAGDFHNNPLEFMEQGKLSALLDKLEADFDWMVIDSPPILPLADTSIWVRLADAVMLVTRPSVTPKRQLQRALEAIEQSKLLGAVLNASAEATTNHYYYHYAPHPAAPKASIQSAK